MIKKKKKKKEEEEEKEKDEKERRRMGKIKRECSACVLKLVGHMVGVK